MSYLQGSILAVVRLSETTIKCCGRVSKITDSSGGRVSFKGQIFFPSISHHSMYPSFECLPAIQWFRTVVNCKLCFVACNTRYAVLSEVKCLQVQFFCPWRLMCCSNMQTQRLSLFSRTQVLQNVALLWQSVATAAEEKKSESSKQSSKSRKKRHKSMHFYHRGSA